MAIEQMAMPQLGESVTEGTISKWLVSPGDHVNKYDPIAEVMTDKVNAEVPSSFTGTITELVGEEGQTLAVGEIICKIETEKTETQEAPKREEEQSTPANNPSHGAGKDRSNKARYSPAVLRLAGEHGIQLEQVEGTGAGGRITRKDIQKIIDSGMQQKTETPKAAAVQAPQEPKQQQKQAPAPALSAGDIEIPVTGVRKAIAANMHKSKTEIPHAWTMMEVDVTSQS